MKRHIMALGILLAAATALAQDCSNVPNTGAPLSLAQPLQHCTLWQAPLNNNFALINTFASTVVLLGPTGSQILNQPSGTFTGLNAAQIIGPTPQIAFGPSLGVGTGFLTEAAPGFFTLDSVSPGNRAATLNLGRIDSGSYTLNGSAPFNHVLLGNGSGYVDSATIPYSLITGAPSGNYQTVAANGSPMVPRPTLNFLPPILVGDAVSPAETNVGLNLVGSESKVVTASASGTNGHCVQWIGTGGIGDAGIPCSPTGGTDFDWTFTTCPNGTGQPSRCVSTMTLPGNMPDSNYQLFCQANSGSEVSDQYIVLHTFPLPTAAGSAISYAMVQVMQNGTSGGVQVHAYCHAHHS